MLRSRKRITRKQLRKPDQFLTLTAWFFRFLEQHRTRIIAIIALLTVVALALWGWNIHQTRQARLAAQAYQVALQEYHKGQYKDALDLLQRVNAPRGSIYNSLALLYQAQSHLALNLPSEAIPLLQEFLKRDPEESYIQQAAYLTLGYAQEMAGQCQQAIEAFSQATKLSGPREEEAILANARCSTQIGQLTEAIKYYREYLSSFPGSSREVEISIRIRQLEARSGKESSESKK